MFDVAHHQRHAGHDVRFWGMAHPDNDRVDFPGQLAKNREFGYRKLGLVEQIQLSATMVFSFQAMNKLKGVLAKFKPDVVHLHNIYHQLSPSILRAISNDHIPMVMTLHDYKLICPNYRLMNTDGPCIRCVKGSALNAFRYRCGESLASSTALALESQIHRLFRAYRSVDSFIAPSRFLADLVRSSGIESERITHIPHFAKDLESVGDPGTSKTILYFGRLSSEKGLDVLIEAFGSVRDRIDVTLKIAGTGPDESKLKRQAKELGLDDSCFLGHLDRDGVYAEIRDAGVVVCPSVWFENQPISILESMSAGVPVVASDIGGISELVKHQHSGLLVPPGETDLLSEALVTLMSDSEMRSTYGQNARNLTKKFAVKKHLDALRSLYDTPL